MSAHALRVIKYENHLQTLRALGELLVDIHGHPPALDNRDAIERVVTEMDRLNIGIMVQARPSSGSFDAASHASITTLKSVAVTLSQVRATRSATDVGQGPAPAASDSSA